MRSARRSHLAFFALAAVSVVVLVLFALLLLDSQRDARTDIEERFAERAEVSAALTASLFSATTATGQQDQAEIYGGRVSERTMDRQAAEGDNVFLVLLDEAGRTVAASSNTPASLIDELEAGPQWVQGVADGSPYGLSGMLDVGGEEQAVGLATGVIAPFDRRILVSGVDPELLGTFIGGYLGEVPAVDDGEAYVLDRNGIVIASTDEAERVGAPVSVGGLADAVASADAEPGSSDAGEFGDGQVFASAPVPDSEWNVVTTAPEGSLFATVTGTSKWLPWLIFVLLAGAAGVALLLARRTLADRERLAASNAELAAAQERLEASHRALERRAEQLARSNAELDQFASIASHDLQEPLRKVQAFSSQVVATEADNLSDKGRDYLERASASALRMQELIEDLLRFSRVGTRTRPFVPTDLGELTEEVLGDLDQVIEEADATIEVGELPTVPVDPPQARQLMQNLISNALKFRREDTDHLVRIQGSVGPRFAEIEVTDNGVGFEPEYADRIFRVFERLHGRGTYPGTGIGLALCRKIVERHGGTIGAQGHPGEGATFVVRLPLEHEDEGEEVEPEPAAAPADGPAEGVPS